MKVLLSQEFLCRESININNKSQFLVWMYLWQFASSPVQYLYNKTQDGRTMPSIGRKTIEMFKTLMMGLLVPALFQDVYFSMKNWVWRSQISWLFPNHYELSENQKNEFFTVILGYQKGAGGGHIHPPHKQHPEVIIMYKMCKKN